MALILRELLKCYHYINTEMSDPRTQNYPLMSSPFPILAIIGSYMYFVQVLGPRLMRDRPPFQLDRAMQIFNFTQIVLSLWMFRKGIYMGWFTTYSWTCQPVDFSDDPLAVETTKIVYFYFAIKLSDFLDTVFFVLRKRTKQVSFLHVYHHAGMAMLAWSGVKYLPGGHSTFVGLINVLVHAVMYSYYLLTSIYPEHKNNIWWKKYITQMQMVQFVLIFIHGGQLFFRPNCDLPVIVPIMSVTQSICMFVLFGDFYRRAYSKQRMIQALKNKD